MSSVVGIDLSTKALDLVRLNQSDNLAQWIRVPMEGKNAWERTLALRCAMFENADSGWENVYLVAIEAPYGPSKRATSTLNRVVGAVAACLPGALRVPERCWLVTPLEWQQGLGLKGKPSWADLDTLAPDNQIWNIGQARRSDEEWQNARDAYCIALWARDSLAAASRADTPYVGAPSSPDRKAL